MSERERILARLAKLKALADGGVGGERENAARLLEEVAARHGVDLGCLEESEKEREHPVEFKRGWRFDLLCQLCGVLRVEQYGDPRANHCMVWTRRRGRSIVETFVICTDSQFVEVMAKFEVLARDYERQLGAFYRAFCQANDLLVPREIDGRRPSKKELEDALLASQVAMGIEKSKLHKQIEGSRE